MDNLFDLSPPVLLVLVLNVVGRAIKKSPMPDWLIVWILPVLGGIVYPFIADLTVGVQTVKSPVTLHVLYGIGLGGLAVWGNQLLRQTTSAFKGDKAIDSDPKPAEPTKPDDAKPL